ncbi:MAG: MSHA biogenesis protein MshP [Oceanospirillaceae bacterium]|jgi:MSHA biogenesis protein MshP
MNKRIKEINKQAGIGLISAIFVITVLALLAAGMSGILANSGKLHSQQILAVRATSAAQSALEIYQSKLSNDNKCSRQTNTVTSTDINNGAKTNTSNTKYTFDTPGLYDCFAQVSCSSTAYNNKIYMSLESLGSCGSDLDVAVKKLQKRIIQ